MIDLNYDVLTMRKKEDQKIFSLLKVYGLKKDIDYKIIKEQDSNKNAENFFYVINKHESALIIRLGMGKYAFLSVIRMYAEHMYQPIQEFIYLQSHTAKRVISQ